MRHVRVALFGAAGVIGQTIAKAISAEGEARRIGKVMRATIAARRDAAMTRLPGESREGAL